MLPIPAWKGLTGLLLAAGMATGLWAVHPQSGPDPGIAPITLDPASTLRVNITPILPAGAPPALCRVAVAFYDSSARLLHRAEFGVRPGHIAFVDLPHSRTGSRTAASIRAVPELLAPANTPIRLLTSLELYDSSSHRTFSWVDTTQSALAKP